MVDIDTENNYLYHNATLSDRRASIAIDTAALTTDKMQADCDDTRFTDADTLNFGTCYLVIGADDDTTSCGSIPVTMDY